jgi:hypothetical protein
MSEDKYEGPDRECPDCGYDMDESGDLSPPSFCPICAGDGGHDVRPRLKPRRERPRDVAPE